MFKESADNGHRKNEFHISRSVEIVLIEARKNVRTYRHIIMKKRILFPRLRKLSNCVNSCRFTRGRREGATLR